jgi:hypothetical protein
MLRAMNDLVFADPNTFAGQLQRGRGIAAQRAPGVAGSGDLIYECVIADARWDRSTEERSSYLARMIHRLDLSTAPLEAHLGTATDADEVWLTLDVLAILGLVGRSDATEVVRRYAVAGEHWSAAIDALGFTGAWKLPGVLDGLAEQVASIRCDAELDEAITGSSEPWTSFGRDQPRIAAILHDRGQRRRITRRDPDAVIAGAAPDDLIDRTYAAGGRGRRMALNELGRQGDLRLLDLAADVTLRNGAGWTPGMPRALEHLGDKAVAAARIWVDGGDTTLAELGIGILATHGDRSDAPTLSNAITRAAQSGAWCATESPARGLGRIGYRDAADLLRHMWEVTEHSVSRHAILEGLAGCAPSAAEACASEGLDDCEPLVQRTACGIVPDTAAIRNRLTELRDDPLASDVTEAAAQRLTLRR